MKIVVIGGTGLIGSKLVHKLREHEHRTVAASPNSGVQHAHRRGTGRSALTGVGPEKNPLASRLHSLTKQERETLSGRLAQDARNSKSEEAAPNRSVKFAIGKN